MKNICLLLLLLAGLASCSMNKSVEIQTPALSSGDFYQSKAKVLNGISRSSNQDVITFYKAFYCLRDVSSPRRASAQQQLNRAIVVILEKNTKNPVVAYNEEGARADYWEFLNFFIKDPSSFVLQTIMDVKEKGKSRNIEERIMEKALKELPIDRAAGVLRYETELYLYEPVPKVQKNDFAAYALLNAVRRK